MIESVDTREVEVGRLIALAREVYRGDPRWIEPLHAERQARFAPDEPFFAHARARTFFAREGGADRATATAAVDVRLKSREGPVGSVGWFECVPGGEGGREVLRAAVAWLCELGLREIWGPLDFSIWHGYRFRVDGFDQTPFLGEPYNPPHYPAVFVSLGFQPRQRFRSVFIDGEDSLRALANIFHRRYARALDLGYRFAPFDPQRFEEHLGVVHAVVMASFRGALGFTELTFDEFLDVYGGLRRLIRPELVHLAWNAAREPAGFIFGFPDVAPAARALHGRTSPWARTRAALGGHRADRVIAPYLAVHPREVKARGGLGAALGHLLHEGTLQLGYARIVHAMQAEGQPPQGGVPAAQHPQRHYVLYRLAL